MAPDDEQLPRRLVYVPLSELPPDPDNEKDHDGAAIRLSIETLGFIEPTIIDERTGKLISGHGRREQLLAMEADGAELPDGLVLGENGEWLAPRIDGWRSRDDDHAAASRVVLNRLGAKGGWIPDALTATLERLDASPTPGLLLAAGWDRNELSDLLASFSKPPALDDLAAKVGESKPQDFWPVLRFTIPPELKARYDALIAPLGADADEVQRLEHLIDRAEVASQPSVALFVGEEQS